MPVYIHVECSSTGVGSGVMTGLLSLRLIYHNKHMRSGTLDNLTSVLLFSFSQVVVRTLKELEEQELVVLLLGALEEDFLEGACFLFVLENHLERKGQVILLDGTHNTYT